MSNSRAEIVLAGYDYQKAAARKPSRAEIIQAQVARTRYDRHRLYRPIRTDWMREEKDYYVQERYFDIIDQRGSA